MFCCQAMFECCGRTLEGSPPDQAWKKFTAGPWTLQVESVHTGNCKTQSGRRVHVRHHELDLKISSTNVKQRKWFFKCIAYVPCQSSLLRLSKLGTEGRMWISKFRVCRDSVSWVAHQPLPNGYVLTCSERRSQECMRPLLLCSHALYQSATPVVNLSGRHTTGSDGKVVMISSRWPCESKTYKKGILSSGRYDSGLDPRKFPE